MSTKIHIQFGDRKFDYEGEAPLAREALIDAFDRLHGGVTPEEHAEEFGSSLATQPEETERRERASELEAALQELERQERPDPLDAYCIARNIWVERHGGSNPAGVGVLAAAILLDHQYPGQPFTRSHLHDSLKVHAPRWGRSWPVMFAGKYFGQAIQPGFIEEASDRTLVLSEGARKRANVELKK